MTGGTRGRKGRKGHRREVCFSQSSTGSDVGGLILPLSYCLSLNSKGRCATDTLMIDFNEHGEIVNNFLDTLYLDRVVRDCFLWYLNDLLIYIFRALHASWHALCVLVYRSRQAIQKLWSFG